VLYRSLSQIGDNPRQPPYLFGDVASRPRKLTQPIRTKDGGALRTVLDARTYMMLTTAPLAVPKYSGHGSAGSDRKAELGDQSLDLIIGFSGLMDGPQRLVLGPRPELQLKNSTGLFE
jgi:hypothetical protein